MFHAKAIPGRVQVKVTMSSGQAATVEVDVSVAVIINMYNLLHLSINSNLGPSIKLGHF